MQGIKTFVKVSGNCRRSAFIVCFTVRLPGRRLEAEAFNKRSTSVLITQRSSVDNHSSDMKYLTAIFALGSSDTCSLT